MGGGRECWGLCHSPSQLCLRYSLCCSLFAVRAVCLYLERRIVCLFSLLFAVPVSLHLFLHDFDDLPGPSVISSPLCPSRTRRFFHLAALVRTFGLCCPLFRLLFLRRTFVFVRPTGRPLRNQQEEKKRGVIAASAGNHALALAWHGTQLGIPVTVVMPTIAPLTKVSGMNQAW